MRDAIPPAASPALRDRLAAAGQMLGAREASYGAALEAARAHCQVLHESVRDALAAFHASVAAAGAPHLRIELSSPRLDDKHVRAVEFEVRRGRHVGLVVVKTKGEVTLVGPFRSGKTEGPCQSLPWDAKDDLEAALGAFLERFVEEAATP
jgi:hypothetical protein